MHQVRHFEDEPGRRQAAHQRRGAKDCREYREFAGAAKELDSRPTFKFLTPV
jgi:hypothetical protein